ncbi:MAG: winged helix-turn-helix transcriptional regulator [Clostridia bacterium]|nr:winged helix-turn-helix transcriptional regulator [Clostridia bacterium]
MINLNTEAGQEQDKRRLTPITTKSLARELDALEAAGIISRTVYPQVPPRVEYSVTELGKFIRPVMDALCAWGRLYGESRNGEKGGKEE